MAVSSVHSELPSSYLVFNLVLYVAFENKMHGHRVGIEVL